MTQPASLPSDFDDFVNNSLRQWGVPGAAVAIVKDDEMVFAQGYGVREVGRDAPMDEHTIFGIGSAAKAFTAAAVAALVDDGKLHWDDPVIEHLADFQLSDPWVTRQVTLRDLLCHRTGLPRGVGILLRSGIDLETYLHRYRHAEFEHSFRSRYLYSNTNFDWAGQVVEAVSGQGWGEFVARRIFEPLEMTASSTNVAALKNAANLSAPHALLKGELKAIPRLDIGDDPAGSINTSAADMAQWLRLQLAGGRYAGAQVLSPDAVREMHAPQMAVPHPEESEVAPLYMLHPTTNFWTYGFGWWVQDYHGAKLVWHGGQINGYASMVAMLPGENFGFAVLTNIHETFLHGLLMFTLLDAYLEVPARDWNADCQKLAQGYGAQQAAQAQKIQSARVEGTSPSLPLSEYAATFVDPWQGRVQIIVENGELSLRYGRSTAKLSHWHYDTFRLIWQDPLFSPEFVTFTLDARGKADRIKVGSLTEFKREPAAT